MPVSNARLAAGCLFIVGGFAVIWLTRQPGVVPPPHISAETPVVGPSAPAEPGPRRVTDEPAEPTPSMTREAVSPPADAPTASNVAVPSPRTTQLAAQTPHTPAATALFNPEQLEADIENVQLTLRAFRDVLGENPVGTNEEITRALIGDNARQIRLELPDGSSVNAAGRLVDRWGTPYFFHQISRERMEIRSAGPDREMWTADDVQR
jgi:hypothetical protein